MRIAIDDFGTGYSSLAYLHRFPIDIVKIDRSFIERLGGVEDGAELARAIITLGDTLGLEVIAEGIELESQQRELIELGCVAGQGFFYCQAGPAAGSRAFRAHEAPPDHGGHAAAGRPLHGHRAVPDRQPEALRSPSRWPPAPSVAST